MDSETMRTARAGSFKAAQTIAVREHHRRITPAHYAKAPLDDEQGMAIALINADRERAASCAWTSLDMPWQTF